MSRSCLGRVSVLSLSFLVMSRCCFGVVSVGDVGDVSVMSRWFVSVVSRSCLCLFWVMSRCCFVGFWVVFWGSFSDVLVTSRACIGEVSVMCGDGAVMF